MNESEPEAGSPFSEGSRIKAGVSSAELVANLRQERFDLAASQRFTEQPNTWRYVVSKEPTDSLTPYAIRELYPSEDGDFSYTADVVGPTGDSLEGLRRDVEHLHAILDLPLLDLTVEPAVLRDPTPAERTELGLD